jgi:myo-inositol 2-dehydrogenase/D-chiro-inositol 1-dehydrogenase
VAGAHSIGIVGAGRIARLHAEHVAGGVSRLRIAAIADPTPCVAAALAADVGGEPLEDWRALVARADVEAVLLCSPTPDHPEQIEAAAAAGKHVLCEKPIASDLEAADRAIAAAERAGIALQIAYNRRFDASFRAVRDAVADGSIGRALLLRITSRDPEPPSRSYLETSPGLFLDTTTHDLDLARFVLGAEIVEVSARGATLFDDACRDLGHVDTAVTTLVFEGAVLGVVDNCWTSAYGYDQRLEVHGDAGAALAGNEASTTALLADGSGFHGPPLPHFFPERYGPAFVRQLEAFADVLEGAPVPITGRDGRQALAAGLAATRSAADGGRPVRPA